MEVVLVHHVASNEVGAGEVDVAERRSDPVRCGEANQPAHVCSTHVGIAEGCPLNGGALEIGGREVDAIGVNVGEIGVAETAVDEACAA